MHVCGPLRKKTSQTGGPSIATWRPRSKKMTTSKRGPGRVEASRLAAEM
jgi:hypothetical protein